MPKMDSLHWVFIGNGNSYLHCSFCHLTHILMIQIHSLIRLWICKNFKFSTSWRWQCKIDVALFHQYDDNSCDFFPRNFEFSFQQWNCVNFKSFSCQPIHEYKVNCSVKHIEMVLNTVRHLCLRACIIQWMFPNLRSLRFQSSRCQGHEIYRIIKIIRQLKRFFFCM